jgi:hypothetical protein
MNVSKKIDDNFSFNPKSRLTSHQKFYKIVKLLLVSESLIFGEVCV